jgi:hypothetical protein
VICLVIALLGIVVAGVPFSVDVGPQTIYLLLFLGGGLTMAGLASFLFFF